MVPFPVLDVTLGVYLGRETGVDYGLVITQDDVITPATQKPIDYQ